MPALERNEAPNATIEALAARVAIRALDLRALVLSAAAVTPFVTWSIADSLADGVYYRDPIATIAINTAELFLEWLIWIFGIVVIGVGGALFAQRKSARLRPLSLTLTSLSIVGLILFVESISFALNVMFVELQHYELSQSETWLDIGMHIVRQTSLLAAVAVASRLYVVWCKPSPDPLDAQRFTALVSLAGILVVAPVLRRGVFDVTTAIVGQWPMPLALLSWVQYAVTSLITRLGAVVLFGSAAIALLRRARLETNLAGVTAASIVAMLSYAVTQHGLDVLPALFTDSNLVSVNWFQVGPVLAVGIFGGPIYLYFVDHAAWRRAIVDLTQSFEALRRWPNPPQRNE